MLEWNLVQYIGRSPSNTGNMEGGLQHRKAAFSTWKHDPKWICNEISGGQNGRVIPSQSNQGLYRTWKKIGAQVKNNYSWCSVSVSEGYCKKREKSVIESQNRRNYIHQKALQILHTDLHNIDHMNNLNIIINKLYKVASVSKTEGRGFESLSPCQFSIKFVDYSVTWGMYKTCSKTHLSAQWTYHDCGRGTFRYWRHDQEMSTVPRGSGPNSSNLGCLGSIKFCVLGPAFFLGRWSPALSILLGRAKN